MKPASLKLQFSAGGVIYRPSKEGPLKVALIATKGGSVWSLPKGVVDKGEDPESTALREVQEETGLKGSIVGKIGDISYWYFIKEENVRCKKTVSYFLMEYESGSTEAHDYEVDAAGWFPIEEAIGTAAYKGDKEILTKAKEMLHGLGGKPAGA